MYNALKDVDLKEGGAGGNILVQSVIILVLLILELIKHVVLVALRDARKMVVFIKNNRSRN